MSQKHGNSAAFLARTTGAGIVVGTNVDIAGIYIGSAPTTVTLYVNTTSVFEVASSLDMYPAVALPNGPITATSSGGVFQVAYIPR